jgi:DNA-binding response OmpR family regulator
MFVGYDPRAVKDETTMRSAATEGQARGRRRLRVLIADDERDQVATLALLLIDEGHEVREVYRGSEVLRLIQDFDPDVALIDIGMPGMSGYDVAREVRKTYGKGRPLLIAVTGWKQSSDRILAKLAGFDHHLPKPFETSALLKLLEPLVSGATPASNTGR